MPRHPVYQLIQSANISLMHIFCIEIHVLQIMRQKSNVHFLVEKRLTKISCLLAGVSARHCLVHSQDSSEHKQ